MLGVTGAVLAAFAAFFLYLVRRARLVAAAETLAGVGTIVQKGSA
jgi:hypothetical protein